MEDDLVAVLGDYDRWLHKVANRYLPWDHPRHDDVVQEGRIAMWRALQVHDPSKGSMASWLTTAAERRMKDVAWRDRPTFGHEPHRGAVDAPTLSVEANTLEELVGAMEAITGIEWAYHHGEIMEALNALTPMQRRYIYARFWLNIEPHSAVPATVTLRKEQWPELGKTHLWKASRARLHRALAHLG